MIISFSTSVTGINTLLSKKFAWKINDLSTEILLDPVLNYTEELIIGVLQVVESSHMMLESVLVFRVVL